MKINNQFQLGIAMVEAAIVLPLVLFLFLGLIDFSRLLYAKVIINAAAHQALKETHSIPLTSFCSNSPNPAPPAICSTMRTGRATAITKATNIITASFPKATTPNSGSTLELLPFNDPYSGTVGTTSSVYVALIRAGEKIEKATGGYFDHPTIPYSGTLSYPQAPTVSAGNTWNDLLNTEPLVVRIEGKVKFLLPLPDLDISATAFGFWGKSSNRLNAALNSLLTQSDFTLPGLIAPPTSAAVVCTTFCPHCCNCNIGGTLSPIVWNCPIAQLQMGANCSTLCNSGFNSGIFPAGGNGAS